MSADIIKACLIDHYLIKNQNYLFGNELMFGLKRRCADLIILKNNNSIIGFEVKSSNDDLRNLKEQLHDYRKVFDYVVVVVAESHLNKIKRFLSKKDGLIVIKNDGKINEIIQPNRYQCNKNEILHSINAKFLKSYFNIIGHQNAYNIRSTIMKLNIETVKEVYISYLIDRLFNKNALFLKERGSVTHFEDIRILSSYNEDMIE